MKKSQSSTVTAVAILYVIGSVCSLLFSGLYSSFHLGHIPPEIVVLPFLSADPLVVFGMLKRRSWARVTAIIVLVFHCLALLPVLFEIIRSFSSDAMLPPSDAGLAMYFTACILAITLAIFALFIVLVVMLTRTDAKVAFSRE